MPIPFASAYGPINLLNDAIQAQAARQQQGYLQASQMNDASVADSLNRVVQQRALQQQAEAQRAHYGLQQQQLANDLAYRKQALGQGDLARAEQARQFDRVAKMNEMLAKAQVERPQLPASAFTEMGRRQEFNTSATGTASGVNAALEGARRTRDLALAEIDRIQISDSIGDQVNDVFTSDNNWSKRKRKLEDDYRAEVGEILKAAQGTVIIRNRKHPQTGDPIPDDYEAVPLALPQLNFSGTPGSSVEAKPDSSTPDVQPKPETVAPTERPGVRNWNGQPMFQPGSVNPFSNFGLPGTAAAGVMPPTTASPFAPSFGQSRGPTMIRPPATNRIFTLTPDGKFVPVQ